MPVVLSQRIDIESEYDDVPFSVYHYPRRYARQLNTGDRFIHYQGNRHKREHRYYFGCGVIGDIAACDAGASYIAKIIDGRPFPNKVPIYDPEGGFLESIGFSDVRNSETPPWQNSIRPISNAAFSVILAAANVPAEFSAASVSVEGSHDLQELRTLNEQYTDLEPDTRDKKIANHLDRGARVTNALKRVLGPQCQVLAGLASPSQTAMGILNRII